MSVESVVVGRNGALLAAAAQLWIPPEAVVLDATYGNGLFWSEYRPPHLIAHDLRLNGVDFRWLPNETGSIDVFVFDPPYTAKGGRETSSIDDMDERYGLSEAPATPELLDELIRGGMREGNRVLKPGGIFIVKTMDYVSGGKYHQGRHNVVTEAHRLGMTQVDEFVHVRGTGPQPKTNLDGTLRRQVHSRRTHGYLCVFQTQKVRRPKRQFVTSQPKRTFR